MNTTSKQALSQAFWLFGILSVIGIVFQLIVTYYAVLLLLGGAVLAAGAAWGLWMLLWDFVKDLGTPRTTVVHVYVDSKTGAVISRVES